MPCSAQVELEIADYPAYMRPKDTFVSRKMLIKYLLDEIGTVARLNQRMGQVMAQTGGNDPGKTSPLPIVDSVVGSENINFYQRSEQSPRQLRTCWIQTTVLVRKGRDSTNLQQTCSRYQFKTPPEASNRTTRSRVRILSLLFIILNAFNVYYQHVRGQYSNRDRWCWLYVGHLLSWPKCGHSWLQGK